MMMDPYYRTLQGFCCVVEKEWLSFGHKFAERTGHGREHRENFADEERSPIFVQFLDCVYQLMNQFPDAFEFTPVVLEVLIEELHACRFATFIHDRECNRIRDNLAKAPSVWSLLLHPKASKYVLNENWRPTEHRDDVRKFSKVVALETVSLDEDEEELELEDQKNEKRSRRGRQTPLLSRPKALTVVARQSALSGRLVGPDPLIPQCAAAELQIFLPLMIRWSVRPPCSLYDVVVDGAPDYGPFIGVLEQKEQKGSRIELGEGLAGILALSKNAVLSGPTRQPEVKASPLPDIKTEEPANVTPIEQYDTPVQQPEGKASPLQDPPVMPEEPANVTPIEQCDTPVQQPEVKASPLPGAPVMPEEPTNVPPVEQCRSTPSTPLPANTDVHVPPPPAEDSEEESEL
jgi:hypothetical protein